MGFLYPKTFNSKPQSTAHVQIQKEVKTLEDQQSTVAFISSKLAALGSARFTLCAGAKNQEESSSQISILTLSQISGSSWWCEPVWVHQWNEIPSRTQMILWKDASVPLRSNSHRDGGGSLASCWHLLVCLCSGSIRADLENPSEEKNSQSSFSLVVSLNATGRTQLDGDCLIEAVGDNPYELIHTALKVGEKTVNPEAASHHLPYPFILTGFGWCSWDSLRHNVSEKGIINAVAALKKQGLTPNWVLIDDGWSPVSSEQKLLGSGARKDAFPHGLAHTVSLLKNTYGVTAVGVWQAFHGYWNGIDPSFAATLDPSETEPVADSIIIPARNYQGARRFWNAWDKQLVRAGIDFVKVDSQGSMAHIVFGEEDYGQALSGRHRGLEQATRECGLSLLNCMGMTPENWWNRLPGSLVRSSDDFLPNNAVSLASHALQNVFSSLFLSPITRLDWDMFWTHGAHARVQALLRWLSGGPIYVSDAANTTRVETLRDPTMSDHQGETGTPIIKCFQHPPRPAIENLLEDPCSAGSAPLILMNEKDGMLVVFVLGLCGEASQHVTSQLLMRQCSLSGYQIKALRTLKLVEVSSSSVAKLKDNPVQQFSSFSFNYGDYALFTIPIE